MARVQMLLSITGGRADGSAWPSAGQSLDCEEREAQELVAGKMARWVPDEERAVIPAGGAETTTAATVAVPAGSETPDAENGSESDTPQVRDPKQTWVDHAIDQGASEDAVAAMTKADLVAQFGNGGPPA